VAPLIPGIALAHRRAALPALFRATALRLPQSSSDESVAGMSNRAEDSFRSLLKLSTDWYWEQDQDFRFTRNVGFGDRSDLRPPDYVGKTRWELTTLGVSEAEWAAHRALLEGHRPFYDFEYLRSSRDGTFRWVSVSGEPVFDSAGKFCGYRGIGKDITERKQIQQRQAVQYAAVRQLSDAVSVEQVMPEILRAVCRIMNWDYGARWTHREQEGVFECVDVWCRPHLEGSDFLALSKSERFVPRPEGFLHRVLETREPLWILDMAAHADVQRADAALKAGLNGAFAFPIVIGGRLLGAVEFFAAHIWQPDVAIGETAKWIGRQIGQFMVRKQAEDSYRELVDLSPDAIVIFCDHRIVFANSAASRLLGAEEPISLLGKHIFELAHPQFRDLAARHLDEQLRAAGAVPRAEMAYLRLDGSSVNVEVSSRYFAFEGKPGVQAIIRDVTERKAAERKIVRLGNLYAALSQTNKAITRLSEPQRLFEEVCRIVVEYGPIDLAGIVETDANTHVVRPLTSAGRAGHYLTSVRLSTDPNTPEGRGLVGTALRTGHHLVCNDVTLDPRTQPWREDLRRANLRSAANFPLRRDGVVVAVLMLASSEAGFFDQEMGQLLLEMTANISFALDAMVRETQRRQAEERLTFLAQFDVLTGLPNRAVFRDRLSQAIARARRNGTLVALMLFDLDRFKQINDTLGHAAGDRVLQVVAARLKEQLREVDTISRLGGDEFTLIAEDEGEAERFEALAEKVRQLLSVPLDVDGRQVSVSTSVGVTVYPRDGEDPDALMKNADIAMYRAKHSGRNNYLFYTAEMARRNNDRLGLASELRQAIRRDDLVIYYQPSVAIESGKIVGVEALLRWHSARGLLTAGEFIPVAEESGLILELGSLVLNGACAQIALWRSMGWMLPQLTINLSARQFAQKDLPQAIATALRASALPAECFALEITESMILHQGEGVMDTLRRLAESGVRVVIDDFGTGYSSFAYLQRLPVHSLKIDRSFVRDVADDEDNATMVRAVVAMARTLDIRVVAEGVETEEQRAVLAELGCDAYQGNLFSPPLPAEEFQRLLCD
jgi:diguanylate cyclase (GGDEF)-like protein/PAS domain S-box-containing protein